MPRLVYFAFCVNAALAGSPEGLVTAGCVLYIHQPPTHRPTHDPPCRRDWTPGQRAELLGLLCTLTAESYAMSQLLREEEEAVGATHTSVSICVCCSFA